MDSDEERARDEEMNKLRSNSASPSTLSTASSGSPLVRGSSGGMKRPAPTSIAVAQLQCQQQQQLLAQQQRLAFTNKLMTGKKGNRTQAPSSSATNGPSSKLDWIGPRIGDRSAQVNVACGKATKKAAKSEHDESKSVGYNVAKSIAFRAYRFNEFWSANKMRYMNLACLLLTLICLITILLFSGSGSNSGRPISTPAKSEPLGWSGKKVSQSTATQGDNSGDEMNAETMDSLDSQALQAPSGGNSGQQGESNSDDFSLFDGRRGASKFRRKSESTDGKAAAAAAASSGEREIEDITSAPTENGANSGGSQHQQQWDEQVPRPLTTGSLIDPILSQIFNDLEMGSLFRTIKRGAAANSTFGRPVIKRSKNGATIIISSSSFDRSSLNDSNVPAPPASLSTFIDRLLPPIFRPMTFGLAPGQPFVSGRFSGLEPPPGGAMRSALDASPSMFSPTTGKSLAMSPFAAAMDPFSPPPLLHTSYFHNSRPTPSSLSMEPVGSFRSPFMAPLFGPGGQPSLLSMIVRAGQSDEADAEDLRGSSSNSSPSGPTSGGSNSSLDSNVSKTNDKNVTQATSSTTSQQNSTQPGKTPGETKTTTTTPSSNESEVETFDLAHLAPGAVGQAPRLMHNFYPRQRPASSMFIFSSAGESPLSRDPFQFPFGPSSLLPSFVNLQPPQVMVINGKSGSPEGQLSGGPLNPILRSILSNVMSDLSQVGQEQTELAIKGKNSNSENNRTRSDATASSNNMAHWASLPSSNDLADDEWPSSGSQSGSPGGATGASSSPESWDERQGMGMAHSSKHLRARHRSDDELEAAPDGPDFVTGLQLEPAALAGAHSPFASMLDRQLESSGVISGTIRQTIRGPGMTVERIIELPATSSGSGQAQAAQVQQVGAGIRSQSLSRLSSAASNLDSESGEMSMVPAGGGIVRPLMPLGSIFARHHSNERSDNEFPPHVGGFISKLLADISRRSSSSEQSPRGGLRNRSLDDDLEEQTEAADMIGPQLQQQQAQKMPGAVWPRIRVASARIRMRPLGELRSLHVGSSNSMAGQPEAQIFMQPPGHFSFMSEADNDKMEPSGGHLFGGSASESKLSASFEDTMNSMEDRLNQVLSVASHQTSGMAGGQKADEPSAPVSHHQQQQHQDINSRPVGLAPANGSQTPSPVAGARNMNAGQISNLATPPSSSHPQASVAGNHQQGGELKLNEQQVQHQAKQQEINPYTSPSSPLFGFPMSPSLMQQNEATGSSSSSSREKPAGNQANVGNRQQRSFTYHSNNEIASALGQAGASERRDHQGADGSSSPPSLAPRPRNFIPLNAPPASVVMGRRIDDRPLFHESPAGARFNPEQSLLAPSALQSSFEERNGKGLSEARNFNHPMSLGNHQVSPGAENYRTIVV